MSDPDQQQAGASASTEPSTVENSPESPSQSTGDLETMESAAEAPVKKVKAKRTAETVASWYAYYDRFIVVGVLLFGLVSAANIISSTTIWPQLRFGQLIRESGPISSDPFAYSVAEDQTRWVNVPWITQVVYSGAYDAFITGLGPSENDFGVERAEAEARAKQFASGSLVALGMLARLLTACSLLLIRRPGPGLWWACLVVSVTFALFELSPVFRISSVDFTIWGLTLLSLELLLIHLAANRGRPKALYGLVPLFLIWANVDKSFLIGLIALLGYTVGSALERPKAASQGTRDNNPDGNGPASEVENNHEAAPAGPKLTGIVLAVSALICLVNPNLWNVYQVPISSLFEPFVGVSDDRSIEYNQISLFNIFSLGGDDDTTFDQLRQQVILNYLVFVGIGIASFLLNAKQLRWSRLLIFATVALLWAMSIFNIAPVFLLVLAVTVLLNGQEWYHERFGTHYRFGGLWDVWSIGGRGLTILLLMLLTMNELTAFSRVLGLPQESCGLTASEDGLPIEAADYLRTAEIQGKIFNTTKPQGDMLIWRAPNRQVYYDGRNHFYGREVFERALAIRAALRDGDREAWEPFFRENDISVVLLYMGPPEERQARRTYQRLNLSDDWVLFYDDGNTVMFGWKGASEEDRAYFEANSLDPERLVFKESTTLPEAERPPSEPGFFDEFYAYAFPTQSIRLGQPHSLAGSRWLRPNLAEEDSGETGNPSLARCFLAIRQARIALSKRPDDHEAFLILSDAYRIILLQESALLRGLVEPGEDPNDPQVLAQSLPVLDLLSLRAQQWLASTRFALQTAPPIFSDQQRLVRRDLHSQLYQVYSAQNFYDLARDSLAEVLAQSEAMEADLLTKEALEATRQQIDQLNQSIDQAYAQLDEASISSTPVQAAQVALQLGLMGEAIARLEEADDLGTPPIQVWPRLYDLYCQVGLPARTVDLAAKQGRQMQTNDRNLFTGPGTPSYRQGVAGLLLGNYGSASALVSENAVPTLRMARTQEAISSTMSLINGFPDASIRSQLQLPSMLRQESAWRFQLGLIRLELGQPELAAESLTSSLELEPLVPVRPLILHYLIKLGRDVSTLPPAETEAPAEQDDSELPTFPTIEELQRIGQGGDGKDGQAEAESTDETPAEASTPESDPETETSNDPGDGNG